MTTSIDVALARLAATQHGLLSRIQIRQLGGNRNMIARRVEHGLLRPVAIDVFAIGGAPVTWRQAVMTAVLSSGDGAVASHLTAAHLLGLATRRPDLIDVTTERPQQLRRTWNAHRSRDLLPHHVTSVDGIPVTTAARTVLDTAGVAPGLVEPLANEAVRCKLTSFEDLGHLVDEVARKGRPGVTRTRALVGERLGWQNRTESELEDRFVALLATAGVPMPSSQVNITDAGGAFVCRADFAFVEHRIAIELDGYRWHSDVAAFNKDRRVQNRLVALSWRVLRFTWWDVDLRPAAVVAEVRSMLALAQADKSGAQ